MLADNMESKVVEIGKVRVKVFDGTVKTLGNVSYVFKLGRGLISLGQLDFLGYGYSARG
jgi:hypothetical protein